MSQHDETSDAPEFEHRPYLTMPGATGMPPIQQLLAQMPKEAQHRFESAGEFIRRLANRIQEWSKDLPEDEQMAILALLPTGGSVDVHQLGEDGHSSVVVEGLLDGKPCIFISHQASFQILCYTQKVEPEKKRRIGFHVGGEELEI